MLIVRSWSLSWLYQVRSMYIKSDDYVAQYLIDEWNTKHDTCSRGIAESIKYFGFWDRFCSNSEFVCRDGMIILNFNWEIWLWVSHESEIDERVIMMTPICLFHHNIICFKRTCSHTVYYIIIYILYIIMLNNNTYRTGSTYERKDTAGKKHRSFSKRWKYKIILLSNNNTCPWLSKHYILLL